MEERRKVKKGEGWKKEGTREEDGRKKKRKEKGRKKKRKEKKRMKEG